MANKTKITVIVIAYNAEKTINKCLTSIYKQRFPLHNYEVILVNDHSSDKTVTFAKLFPNIRVVNQVKNIHGIAPARNLGIMKSRSEIVAFTDSDCIVPPNWLSEIYCFLTNNRNFVGVGGVLEAIKTENIFSYIDGVIGEAYGNNAGLATPNAAYFKKDLIKHSLFDPQLVTGEDTDLNWRLEKGGYKLKILNGLVVKHLWRASLKSFIKHQFNYGRGRAQLIKKHPEKYSVFERNIIPSFFVLLLLALLMAVNNLKLLVLLSVILLPLFTLIRRVRVSKNILIKSSMFIYLLCIFYFILIDVFNIFGIFYQLIKKSNK